ncbi:hypothetical protein Ae201684P_015285 [Aphanomyces euteiches]|nr:hypothetical protein Ae201684P_015285 [Aphanomyces euteiches]
MGRGGLDLSPQSSFFDNDGHGDDKKIVALSRALSRCSDDFSRVDFSLVGLAVPQSIQARDADGHDTATLDTHNGRLRIRGSSATAIGFALHKYLKDIVHTQMDWDNHDLNIPIVLPPLSNSITVRKHSQVTYYLNVVTTSYSFWSWGWEQWEKHIDWMALNGINMPLAFTGQEKVWLETFKQFNVSTAGMLHFFAGAAFQAWGRMGNIRDSWGPFGTVPLEFIEDQFKLQLQILDRMKEFGMVPALPAFAGHVPEELVHLYPHAEVRKSSRWAGFPEKFTCVHMLDPTDPLYLDIGRTFIETQTKLYGGYTSSVYQTDTYNELQPHTSDAAYLRASSKAVIDSMLAADPNAVWIMQGWLFYFMSSYWTNDKIEAYLGGVANDRLIMLDLWSESFPVWSRTSSYFGKPWIYCVLHTFGGNLGLHGNLKKLASDPITSHETSQGHMIGLGLTMEGVFQNYVVYDLALEMAWNDAPVPLDSWLLQYIHRRYHVENEHATAAWAFLKQSVYQDQGLVPSLSTVRPRWKLCLDAEAVLVHRQEEATPLLPASNHEQHAPDVVKAAWSAMITAAKNESLQTVDSFQHDLVDLTRQVLSNLMATYYADLTHLYHDAASDPKAVCAKGDQILELMLDLDEILATNKAFLLGVWIRDAKARGTAATAPYFEYQARNQLTRWGVGTLNDYANKQWAGLMKDYYVSRWRIWLDAVCAAKKAHTPMDDAKVDGEINAFEIAWQTKTDIFSSLPQGDTVQVATRLFAKYTKKAIVVLDEVVADML